MALRLDSMDIYGVSGIHCLECSFYLMSCMDSNYSFFLFHSFIFGYRRSISIVIDIAKVFTNFLLIVMFQLLQ